MKNKIRFGPAGLGPVKPALNTLEKYKRLGLSACEIAFTYGAYIKPEECDTIRKKAEELDISLSIHAPYYINLNSADKEKIEASKKRIVDCCRIGELLGAKKVVFHPGFYGNKVQKSSVNYKENAFENIKKGVIEIMSEIERNGWKIKIAAETMGKINVFGSVDEIRRLVDETGCSFCLDFAHILARYKKIDLELIEKTFPEKEWHVHFSGIEYGEKGEKKHKPTLLDEWKNLLENFPRDKSITIISEAPSPIEDSVKGNGIAKKLDLSVL